MAEGASTSNQRESSWADKSASPAEALLAECLELPTEQRNAALDRLCDEHPEHADELRELAGSLRALGMMPSVDGELFPERLGDFRLVRRMGSGGMGVVYLAKQEPFERDVALKLMHPATLFFPGARERFQREAQAIANLDHPDIVSIHAVGEEQDVPYMVMEWVDGLTLTELVARLRSRPPVQLRGTDLAAALDIDQPEAAFDGSWTEACSWLIERVCRALNHAHSRGIVHRDVKASNVMVTPRGRVVLLDFGLATTEEAQSLTRTGTQPGSTPYMSPEQVRGEAEIDGRSDVYSLGVTLYELLTLQQPFLGENDAATRELVLRGQPTPVRARNPAASRDTEIVCHKAMEQRPTDRYQSALAFAQDLARIRNHEPVVARPPGTLLRLAKWAQRNPGVAAMTALVAIVLLATTAWTLRQNHWLDSARTAAESESQAKARVVERMQRLSDHMLVSELLERARHLPAIHPDNEAVYASWVADAEGILQRLPVHQATIEELNAAAAGSSTNALRWEAATLRETIQNLQSLTESESSLLPFVRNRHELTANLRRRTIDEASSAWQLAADQLRADPRFRGVELTPQIGLVPLGADPVSGLQEFLHLASHTGPLPKRDPLGQLDRTGSTGILMVLLPGDTFWMGTQKEDPDGPNYSPSPQRYPGVDQVTLAPFFIGKYEVTRPQWQLATNTTPSLNTAVTPDLFAVLPVQNINWYEARDGLAKFDLLLPTEAQWEYACRAGTESIWSTGNTPGTLQGYANLAGREEAIRSPHFTRSLEDRYTTVGPIGKFLPNPFGLYDTYGNLAEWCRDGFAFYDQSPALPGDGYRDGSAAEISALRGGSFRARAAFAASAMKSLTPRTTRMQRIGVRAARALRN